MDGLMATKNVFFQIKWNYVALSVLWSERNWTKWLLKAAG